ncbi:MAG: DUF333 domain-containing protein [Candidatus Aenigmarchaeota archaeon]|nr:DUF333 domain-containing protein [Candidatus Aenigmarchaeota archaeon]
MNKNSKNVINMDLIGKYIFIFIMISFILNFIFITYVYAIKSPDAVYCEALGYTFKINQTTEGEVGICEFPNGSSSVAFDFLKGKSYQEFSYCKQNGYEIKTIHDVDKCAPVFSEECAVCVLKNGTEIEVTTLMGLDFSEGGGCGNAICTPLEEDYSTCPQDCPSGSHDMYCDGVEDGKCDPDCVELNISESDPDCVTQTTLITKCGNGMCDKDENYGSCPQDCESGRRDGYCDGVKDGRCDPDCPEERDVDCKGGANKFLIAIILLVVGIVAFLIFRSTKYGEQKYE